MMKKNFSLKWHKRLSRGRVNRGERDLFSSSYSLIVRESYFYGQNATSGHLSHPRIRNIIPGGRLELNFKRARVASRYYATSRESISWRGIFSPVASHNDELTLARTCSAANCKLVSNLACLRRQSIVRRKSFCLGAAGDLWFPTGCVP